METCSSGHVEVVKLLLNHNADPNAVAGETSGNTTALLEVITYVEDRMEEEDGSKAEAPLIVKSGIALMQILLDAGADPMRGGVQREDQPLCRAARVHASLRATIATHMAKKDAAAAATGDGSGGKGGNNGTAAARAVPSDAEYQEALNGYTVVAEKAQEYLLVLGCLLESASVLGSVAPPSVHHVETLRNHIAAMSKKRIVPPRCVALLNNMEATRPSQSVASE